MERFVVFKVGFTFADWSEFDNLKEAIKYRDQLIAYGYNANIFVRIDFCDDMIDEK